VRLFDEQQPRNARARAAHGYLTCDGMPPSELLRIGRDEVRSYGVAIDDERVVDAARNDAGFEVTTQSGAKHQAQILVLATGIVDCLPDVPGIDALYGRSAFTCPYCDAWEVRDRPLAVLGAGNKTVELALALTVWSRDVVLCTHAQAPLRRPQRERLRAHGVEVRTERVARLEGRDGQLEHIVFERGPALRRDALFFHPASTQRSPLPAQLGCAFEERGAVKTSRSGRTEDRDLFIVGDASEDATFIAVAVSEGVKAGCAINMALRTRATEARLRSARAA
jgi:thioredoxin reductase